MNEVSDEKGSALDLLVAKTAKAIKSRSVYGRNPEIGRMIKCAVCRRRHRDVIKCVPKYYEITYEMSDDTEETVQMIASQFTYKGVNGAASVAKKRFHPHLNRRDLQLIMRTRELFPQHEPYFSDPMDAMKEARHEAKEQLEKERRAQRKFKRRQQDAARRINFGLEEGGARA
jgi:hypothetical protein